MILRGSKRKLSSILSKQRIMWSKMNVLARKAVETQKFQNQQIQCAGFAFLMNKKKTIL